MMSGYYAGEGCVGSEPFDGAIEISEAQYQAALNGMMAGKIVTVDGGFAVTDPPPPPAPEPEPEPEPVIPDSVSARQFKLQLLASGLLDQVEGWIATQDKAVQIAYANSGSFVRTEPMMQTGFAALGFTATQIDAFFTAAATL